MNSITGGEPHQVMSAVSTCLHLPSGENNEEKWHVFMEATAYCETRVSNITPVCEVLKEAYFELKAPVLGKTLFHVLGERPLNKTTLIAFSP